MSSEISLKPGEGSTKIKRRPRYMGTHPRNFHEKYKEHAPERYPEEIKKIIEAGKTPAGTHRPICVQEILEILKPQPGMIAVDSTLGYGGHAIEILKGITPGGRLIGFDVDTEELPKTEQRIRAQGFEQDSFTAVCSNFSRMPLTLKDLGLDKVDLILADLGVSSMQLDNPDRGFTFKADAPLDLRMNPKALNSAARLLARISEKDLALLLEENADEIFSVEIARAISIARKVKPIETTGELVDAVRDALSRLKPRFQREQGDNPIRRTFQALRIAVNDEFGSLETFLANLPQLLKSQGRVAILTFHSGEDRRVKKAFQMGYRTRVYSQIADVVIRPTAEEVRANPRASSAKLRWAIKA